MSLKHAILALLDHEDSSGYDLTKKFEGSIGLFWRATHQQIYQELKSLSAEKFVSFQRVAQTERPDKKIYHLESRGKGELERWLLLPTALPPIKEGFLVKIFAGHLIPRDQLIADLVRHRTNYERLVGEYLAIEKTFPEPTKMSYRKRLRYLTLRRGIRFAREWVEWCDEALSLLKPAKSEKKSR